MDDGNGVWLACPIQQVREYSNISLEELNTSPRATICYSKKVDTSQKD